MRIFLDSNAPEFFNDISESIRAFYPQAIITRENIGADFLLRLSLIYDRRKNKCSASFF